MQGQGGGMLGRERACMKAERWETACVVLLGLLEKTGNR